MAPGCLQVISGDGRGTAIPLDGELVLGRSTAGLELLRGDTEISRVHARVWRDGDGNLMIEDLGSRNGTFVNGWPVENARPLHPGDWLRTGRTTFELVDDAATNGAPKYDALVEEDDHDDADGAEQTVVAAHGSPGHFVPWPIAAVLLALLAGGGVGAAVVASRHDASTTKTSTRVVTREIERPAPAPHLSAPASPAQLPASPSIPASRDAFTRAFCGHGSGAPTGLCRCTYTVLLQRETYSVVLTQVAASTGGRIAPAISRAARACGASA